MGLVPKDLQKPLLYGALIGAGLFALYIAKNGVRGVTANVVGGLVGGVVDATTGVLQGAYNAIPEPIKPTNNDNVIYKAVNKQYEFWGALKPGETIGTKLYDIFN